VEEPLPGCAGRGPRGSVQAADVLPWQIPAEVVGASPRVAPSPNKGGGEGRRESRPPEDELLALGCDHGFGRPGSRPGPSTGTTCWRDERPGFIKRCQL
jgi:hypothetical protein